MRHLMNIYDPRQFDARNFLLLTPNETVTEAWAHLQEWLKDKLIGEPKPSRMYTAEQLKNMGVVGVYQPNDNSETW